MLTHAEVVKPPALTVHAMQAANARARRLGRAPVFVLVRQRTTSGRYVAHWVRLARAGVGGGVVTAGSTVIGDEPQEGPTTPSVVVTAPPLAPPTVVGGVENGMPVR